MRGSRKKMPKSPFLSFLAKKGHFGQFLAKTVKIIKKALGTFFSHLQALTNCKVSEKSNERFPRKNVTDARTQERTAVHKRILKTQNDRWSRDQKIR